MNSQCKTILKGCQIDMLIKVLSSAQPNTVCLNALGMIMGC